MKPASWLIFMSDQQHASTCEPGSPVQAPHVAALAAAGTTFTRAFCPSPICTPARASCQTGLLPHQHRMVHNTGKPVALVDELPAHIPTLGDHARGLGYHTAYVGKWHLGVQQNPDHRGYDSYDVGAPPKLAPQTPIRDVFRLNGDTWRHVIAQTADIDPAQTEPMTIAAAADRRLRDLVQGDRPFLLFVSTVSPHVPWRCPTELAHHYRPDTIARPASYDDPLPTSPSCYRRQNNMHNDTPVQGRWPEVAAALTCYLGMCELVDMALGVLLRTLQELGRAREVGVMFMSDHGEMMGRHGRIGKGDYLYDDILRIPLIVAPPGGSAVRRSDALVSLCDVLATCFDGVLDPRQAPPTSRSLLPFTRDASATGRDALLIQHYGAGFHDCLRGLRTADWKYVYRPNDQDELFDLRRDPDERVNLAAHPDHGPTLRQMRLDMIEQMKQVGDPFTDVTRYSLLENPLA
jgi:arylsulfatase A-like enzyme